MRSYLGFFAGLVIVGLAPDLAALADETAAGDVATTAAAGSKSTSGSTTAEPSASQRANRKRTGETQYNWAWLAARYDKDGDERLSPQELSASKEVFDRLDRSWDGMLSAADFDWSAEGALCQQKGHQVKAAELAKQLENGSADAKTIAACCGSIVSELKAAELENEKLKKALGIAESPTSTK